MNHFSGWDRVEDALKPRLRLPAESELGKTGMARHEARVAAQRITLLAEDDIGDARVSTSLITLGHERGSDYSPAVFETTVVGGYFDQTQEHCETREEAEAQHAAILELVRKSSSRRWRLWQGSKAILQLLLGPGH